MMLPEKVFVTRGEVINGGFGISRKDFDKAIRAGALTKMVFPGRRYGKYRRDEVSMVFGLGERKVKSA